MREEKTFRIAEHELRAVATRQIMARVEYVMREASRIGGVEWDAPSNAFILQMTVPLEEAAWEAINGPEGSLLPDGAEGPWSVLEVRRDEHAKRRDDEYVVRCARTVSAPKFEEPDPLHFEATTVAADGVSGKYSLTDKPSLN